ncbi:MAG: hypothetical protein JWO00_694 [Candidatus Parcubacteria bacterium]|nr:hypothetical protein [Candidatus Parcubacteria bacterium]
MKLLNRFSLLAVMLCVAAVNAGAQILAVNRNYDTAEYIANVTSYSKTELSLVIPPVQIRGIDMASGMIIGFNYKNTVSIGSPWASSTITYEWKALITPAGAEYPTIILEITDAKAASVIYSSSPTHRIVVTTAEQFREEGLSPAPETPAQPQNNTINSGEGGGGGPHVGIGGGYGPSSRVSLFDGYTPAPFTVVSWSFPEDRNGSAYVSIRSD